MKQTDLFHLSQGRPRSSFLLACYCQSIVADVLSKENPEQKVRRVGSFAGAGLILPLVTFDGFVLDLQGDQMGSSTRSRGS